MLNTYHYPFLLFLLSDAERAFIGDTLKIVVPLIIGLGGTWLANRRENRIWRDKQEIREREMIDGQTDKISLSWDKMTTQLRDMIDRLQNETIMAVKRAVEAEEKCAVTAARNREIEIRNKELERELEDVRRTYRQALQEIEELRERGKRISKPKAGI